MAGLIRDEDIAEVREKIRIDDVVSEYVTLKNAGGGSLKGLCPFHDEKTPSFHVTPARSFWHCFGCGEGGDAIAFLMKIDGLGFVETVERLAEKCGIVLRRLEGEEEERPRGPGRGRLVDAHNKAQEFYAEQLAGPDALAARQFLHSRGFDQEAAARFGVGFAPRDGEALLRHLRGRGFGEEELVVGGLVGRGRGLYDRFRGRLLWPIRDSSGDVIGFGARRIFDDDRIEAKYLNTPESPIYKKSQVLYGIDLARRSIARSSQAVVVEGYTDVMACHLAGVETAVATCGTAFGDDHARVLRRFLHDHEEFRGEVIFTFDGDAAGQAAALKAFKGDQNFVSQTYVAVEPSGKDPCELRVDSGDAAVRELIARRVPLYRFVLGNVLERYDLDRADSRIDALREAAGLVASIRDRSKVDAFARELAGMIGVDVEQARSEVRRAQRAPKSTGSRTSTRTSPSPRTSTGTGPGEEAASGQSNQPSQPPVVPWPDPRDPRYALERDALKVLLQYPTLVGDSAEQVGSNDFLHPGYRELWEQIAAIGIAAGGAHLAGRVGERLTDQRTRGLLSALTVEPLHTTREPDAGYVATHMYRLQELTVRRRIDDVKSRLQRTNPVEQATEYNRMFGEVVALEQHRRQLRERSTGLA